MVKSKASGKAPAMNRGDSFELPRMTPVQRLPLPSEPDRCFRILVVCRGKPSSLPEITLTLAEQIDALVTLDAQWEPSEKESEKTGFLDLPREVRDMIYQEISVGLKREGLRWEATAPAQRTDQEDEHTKIFMGKIPWKARPAVTHEDRRAAIVRPSIFSDCAIMRTCRQLHSEFATMLYSSPLQLFFNFQLHESGVISISPLYASLVRSVLIVETCLNDASDDKSWRRQLQFATSLSKLFPQADCIRLGWFVTRSLQDPALLTSKDPEAWDATVRTAEKAIKSVKKLSRTISNVPLIVPHNLEVVQLLGTKNNGHSWPNQFCEVKSLPTPVTEAVRNLRAKQPLRKGLRKR